MSIVYLLVIVVLAPTTGPRAMKRSAAMLIVLTYLGLLIKIRFENETLKDLIAYRLFNRSLVAVGIAVVAVLSISMARLRLRMTRVEQNPSGADSTEDEFARLFLAFARLRWSLRSGAILVGVLLVDLVTPAPFNLPILYVVPVLTAARGQSRYLLWMTAGLALLCSMLGYWLGPQPWTQIPSHYLLLNRALACAVIFGVSIVLHRRLAKINLK